jgi:hypothetical protein
VSIGFGKVVAFVHPEPIRHAGGNFAQSCRFLHKAVG